MTFNPTPPFTVYAPAKVNLFLHVTGQRGDGYHLLDSLTVFAKDVCDVLTFTPADDFTLGMTGPFADAATTTAPEDNLVLRACRLMARETGRTDAFSVTLEKNVPVGAGLGGGSGDAAATVKALENLWNAPLPPDRRPALLASLGADVPVCDHGRACRFQGIGDVIEDAFPPPSFFLVTVWPDTHVSTKEIFKSGKVSFGDKALSFRTDKFDDLVEFLKNTRNDLYPASSNLAPVIAAAIDALADQKGCRLARMSGSGAAVFGIFARAEDAETAAFALRAAHPAWWIAASAVI